MPISEISDILCGYAFDGNSIVEYNTPYRLLRGVNITEGIIRHSNDVDRFISGPINNKLDKYILKRGDLVIGMDGSKVGRNSAIIGDDESGSYLVQRVCRIRANETTTSLIFHQVNNPKFHRYVDNVKTSSAIPHISQADISKFNIALSSNYDENVKIIRLLNKLDERIATQNKIIEDLKKLKSAIIDKLYSEVTGDTFSYSELFTVITERNSKRIYNKVIAASQEHGMVERESLNLNVQFDKDSINTYKIIQSGDYVIHLRSFQGGFAFSRLQGICSPAYIILRPNNRVEYSYFENYFISSKFINSLRLVTYGIRDGRSINVDEWLNMKVTLPSKEEQKRIIRTIQSIQFKLKNESDVMISLHGQRSCLLQEMFI